jgi:hypothetical protein
MKARRKGTNEPFQKVASVCLCSGGYILVKDVEFEQEPTSDQWQDVRERAAIAAMQGLILSKFDYFSEIKISEEAIKCADALVERLKGE